MTDAQKLIARVLQSMRIRWDDTPGVSMWLVGNRHFQYKVDAEGFVAAEIDKALGGLTQEKRTLHNGWVQPGYGAEYYACGETPPPAVITNETRWVSGYTEVTE